MKVEIIKETSWASVLNAARFTWRKDPMSGDPSSNWKKKIIRAEHSPLRCLMFTINIYDIPSYTAGHFVRHVHAQPFVSSSRPDVDKEQVPRSEQKKSDLVNIRLFLNAEEIINISRKRLCNKAETETILVWKEVLNKLVKIEPELITACVPNCIYRGFCPEFKSCGYSRTERFIQDRNSYLLNI